MNRAPGPTVYEAAVARHAEIRRQMELLEEEKKRVTARIRKYAGSKMQEAERLASEGEPYQRQQWVAQDIIDHAG